MNVSTRSLLVISSVLLCALAPAAPAAAKKDKKESAKYTVAKKAGEKLGQVHDLIQAEKNAEAIALLDSFNLDRMKPYPAALVHQAYGFIEVSNDDFEKAAGHFQKAVELDALPPTQQMSMRFNLGQMYMMLDRWDDAIATLERWFADSESPSPVAYYMLALAYYQSGDLPGALAPATEAVDRAEDPRESWIQLLLSLHMTEQRYEQALPLLERLALRYPKNIYWTQLAGVLAELEREDDSLAVQQLAYAKGLLETDRELVRLSQTCVVQGIPWQGAKVMREGLESGSVESDSDAWGLLSNTLLAARENAMALEPLARAAELAEGGEGYLQLGQVFLQSERWGDALDAFAQALEKGGLERPGQVHLLIGVAAYQQKSLVQAKRALARAMSDEAIRDTARQWLDFVEREQASAAVAEPG